MSDLSETMGMISIMIDQGGVDEAVLGDLDLAEVIQEVSGLVSGELMHFKDLSGDDPQHNENVLRDTVQNAAFKAFFAGLVVGTERAAAGGTIIVEVPADAIEQIGLQAIRQRGVSFQLRAVEEEGSELAE